MIRRGSRKWVGWVWAFLGMPGLLLLGAQTPSSANTYNYASQKRQIKACVLVSNAASTVVNGTVVPENAVPYVFYMMERRTDLKPAGWQFINPLAASTVSPDIRQRWVIRDTGNTDTTLADPAFVIGAPLTKNIGAYWEVNLDSVSPTDLQQFDIVLLAYHNGSTQFSPHEREMLRKYVDAGGTIWLEDEGGFDIQSGGNHKQGQFVVDTAFNGGVVSAANLPSLATIHHPLVNFPFPISGIAVQALGQAGIGVHHIAIDPIAGPVNPRDVVPVIWSGSGTNNLPLVYAGDYGAGHIVISSAGIATGINSYVGGPNVAGEGGNSGAISGENTLGVQLIDAEFAYNMISWTSSVATGAYNVRRSGGTREDIGSLLGTRWSTIPNPNGMLPDSGVTIYKSVAFYVDGVDILHAYDTSPSEDLDGDGNPDDGIPDLQQGAPYDEIWRTQLTNGLHYGPPTLFSVNNNGTVSDLVAVQGSNGVTTVFNAFPLNANGTLAPSPGAPVMTIAGGGSGTGDYGSLLANHHNGGAVTAPSPAYSDGILFTLTYDNMSGAITDPINAWRVFPTDPLTGANVFVGAANNAKLGVAPSPQALGTPLLGMPSPMGPPAVGYILDATTGAEDKMVYVPTLPPNNDLGDPTGSLLYAHLFSVKNEPLLDNSPNVPGTQFRATLRRGNIPWFLPSLPFAGMRSLLPVCHRTTNGVTIDLAYDPTGASANSFQVIYTQDTGPLHQVIVIPNPPLNVGDTLTADYTTDWPGAPLPNGMGGTTTPSFQDMQPLFRSYMIPNPNIQQSGQLPMQIVGGAALSADDLAFVNVGDAPMADRIYAIHEHFPIGNPSAGQAQPIPGTPRPTATAVQWMFYPNGPIADESFGPQGILPRLVNTDQFGPLKWLNGLNLIAADLEVIGAPAYSNGVVYQVGWTHMQAQTPGSQTEFNAALIMAYQANPSLSFVPRDADGSVLPLQGNGGTQNQTQSTGLQLIQPDILHLGAGGLVQQYLTLNEGVNFTVDYATNTITVFDCRTGGNRDVFNLALPFQVGRGGKPLGTNWQVNANGYGLLDNLLWWMIVPISTGLDPNLGQPPPIPGLADVKPASGPTIIGNSLFYGTEHGHLASIDLSGITTQNGLQVPLFKSDGITPRVSLIGVMADPTDAANGFTLRLPIINPPAGTTDVMLASTPQGLTAFDNQLTVISDNNRLIEVNYAGQATWSMDSSQTQTVVGGTLLSGIGNVANSKISLARPNVVRHSNLNDFLVADSGNNRVIQVDRGGIVSWEMHSFNNDMRFVRAGDPLTLNQPTDIQTYTLSGNGPISFTSPITGATYSYTGIYNSYHYLVADSGNNRLLEIVDVYDGNGNPVVMTSMGLPNVTMLRQVTFVTQTLAEQNKALRYRTVQEFTVLNQMGNPILYMGGAVDNEALGGADPLNNTTPTTIPPPADREGGSLMIFYRPGGVNDGALASKITGIWDPVRGTHTPLVSPTFFQEYETDINNVAIQHYLVCDANGCYDLVLAGAPNTPPGANNGEAVVYWALYSADYQFMTGRPLRAYSLKKLGQADYLQSKNIFCPHYLITNRYEGSDNVLAFNGGAPLANVSPGLIHGEVAEVQSLPYFDTVDFPGGYQSGVGTQLYNVFNNVLRPNLGGANGGSCPIVWMIPRETVSLLGGPLPIQRSIGVASSSGTSSFILEQPTYSDRPY